MKPNFHRVLGILVLLITGLSAREWRTPREFDNGYPYAHYPFLRVDGRCWNFNLWAAGLYRLADEAFLDKDTTKRENLAGIIFGKPVFTLADLGIVGLPNITFRPVLDYKERNAYFGFIAETVRGCDCQWRIGVRANLPFRNVQMNVDCCGNDFILSATSSIIPTTTTAATQLCVCQNELVCNETGSQRTVENSFACRLDYLSRLLPYVNSPFTMVQYTTPVRFNTRNVTETGNSNDATGAAIAGAPIMVVSRPDGTPPPAPFARIATGASCPGEQPSVAGLPPLAGNGAGLPANARARFDSGTNYAALAANPAQQATLWVVPTVASNPPGGAQIDLVADARNIRTTINNITQNCGAAVTQQIINGGGTLIPNILTSNCILFNNRSNTGVGDLDVEFYARRDWCNYFIQPIFGFRFPTGRRIAFPNELLLMPTGNNGHLEVKFGVMGGWNPTDWFALKADAFYNFATSRNEKVAASFVGQCVKNIGPCTNANVNWRYFVGDVDFTFMIPCIDPSIGVDAGYQLYIKRKDKISFDCTTARNIQGIIQMLDPSVLEYRTDEVAHKVKSEVFYQNCDWHLFAGFQHVFAGKNAPNDSDWYLGLQIYF